MVCRQHAASSVAIALGRPGAWLDDDDVHSIVHRFCTRAGRQPPWLEPDRRRRG